MVHGLTTAQFEQIAQTRVDIYQQRKLVCRCVSLADCYPGEPETIAVAAAFIRQGKPYVTRIATLCAAE